MIELHKSFFPEIYEVTTCQETDTGYKFDLLSFSDSAFCPNCHVESRRQHGYLVRTARDLPILGKSVTLVIRQKKYFCDNGDCETDIFSESNTLISQYSQFTLRCREYMLKVATLVSCESAVKILAYQGIRVSGDTLLNMLKTAGKEYVSTVGKNIGIDDWAYRRGQKYGTIICDLDTHEIVDVLEGRDSETLEKWLRGHPDIEIVSRDRASAYSSAVTKVLPNAVQIADRFHITKNLLEALNDTIKTLVPEIVAVPCEEVIEPSAGQQVREVKKTRKRSGVKPRS